MSQTYKEVVEKMNRAYDEFSILISQETKKLDELGLTTQQEMMISYINKSENTTANDMAAAFNITKSAVIQVLSNLDNRDLISKHANPNNKRESFLTLGPKGREYMERLLQLDDVLIDKYYSKIDIEALQRVTEP